MKQTEIQWCHSTINPVMGCDGCELWSPPGKIKVVMIATIQSLQQAQPESETCTSQIPDKHSQTSTQ